MSPLPDATWCQDVSRHLSGSPDWKSAVEKIGEPLYIKVKTDDEAAAVILHVGDAQARPAVSLHPAEQVEGDGIIVSMKHEVWDRLLRGSTDLMTAFMGRDIKAKASMLKLMKITDPAERLIQLIGTAQRGGR